MEFYFTLYLKDFKQETIFWRIWKIWKSVILTFVWYGCLKDYRKIKIYENIPIVKNMSIQIFSVYWFLKQRWINILFNWMYELFNWPKD